MLVRGCRRGLFEHAVRVAQPPDQSSSAGPPAGAVNRGRLFFGYFILAKQKKVACCRATPAKLILFLSFMFRYGLRPTQHERLFDSPPLKSDPHHRNTP